MIGVTPNYEITLREDILHEEDGPTLVYGLQELHGQAIQLPTREVDWSSHEALAWRYMWDLNR
jgi:putative restriction endonuclease